MIMALESQILYTEPYQDDRRAISAPAPGESVRAFVEDLIDRLKQTRSYWAPYHRTMVSDRALYDPKQRRANKPYPEACELSIPMLIYAQQNIVAREKKALFSPDPMITAMGRLPWDRQFSNAIEDYLQRRLGPQYMCAEERLVPVINGAHQDGASFAYLRYRHDPRMRRKYALVQRPYQDVYGNVGLTPPQLEPVPEQYPLYDGLEIVAVDADKLDIYPPTARSVSEAHGVAFRSVLSGNELLMEGINGNFDMAAVEYLRDGWQGDAYEGSTEHTARGMAKSLSTHDPRNFTFRPYNLTECFWLYSPQPGMVPASIYQITIHEESRTVLRFRPNPWWHGEIPMVEFVPLPGKAGMLGRSLPDLAGDSQQWSTVLMRLYIDGLAKHIHKPLLARAGALSKAEMALFKRGLSPGAIWEVNDPESFRALEQELGDDLQLVIGAMEMMRQQMARATGMDDTNLGVRRSGDPTATEIQHTIAEGEVLFGEMTDNLARSFSRLARLVLASDLQMALSPSVQRVWAESVGPDPTGMQALQALSGDYDLISAGNAEMANQQMRMQRAILLYDKLIQNPLVANNLMHIHALTLDLVSEFRVRYPERVIGSEQEAMMQAQVMQRVQMAQMMAPQVPGGGNQGAVT